MQAEQLIVQYQHKAWIAVTELRNAPAVGAGHIYLYARYVPGLNDTRPCTAHFRIESWRQVGEVIQPGIRRREFIIPDVTREQATLHALHQALITLQNTPPQRLIIHHASPSLMRGGLFRKPEGDQRHLRAQVQALLQPYAQIIWQPEPQPELLNRIGTPISKGQQLWNHTKSVATYQGLYQ